MAINCRHMSCKLLCLLLAFLAPPASRAAEPAATLDPGRLEWQHAVYRASKFLISMQSSVEISILPSASVEADLARVEGENPVTPAAETAVLSYDSDGMGRHSDTTLLMNPLTAAALQYETYEPGSRRRIYRYMNDGAYVRTWRPTDREKKLEPGLWTDRSEGFRPYPDDPRGQPVIDPIGLLYIVATTDLGQSADELSFLALNRNRLSRITFISSGRSNVAVNFSTGVDGERHRCKGKVSALHVRINASPFGSETETKFDFLGLQSDISIYLEPETRLPLLITGRAKVIGMIKIRLVEASVAGHGCPDFVR